jgi:ribA/ribD-fused uncharacterized protein
MGFRQVVYYDIGVPKMTEKFTLFYGGPFSQWNRGFPYQFEVDGINYNCAEQYMMAEKARLFGDKEVEKQIMAASHPRDQKAIGRLVKNFDADRWNLVARNIVYEGSYAKFTQNEGLKMELLETEGTTLVEASPYDAVWGVKLAQDNPDCHDRSKWKGTNWLGEVLDRVRCDIKAGVKTSPPSAEAQPVPPPKEE